MTAASRLGAALLLLTTAGTVAAQPAPPAPSAPSGDAAAGMRLGRKYPVPGPSQVGPKEPPQVYVSVVSPEDSSVHQKTGRFRRGRAADAGQVPPGNGTTR